MIWRLLLLHRVRAGDSTEEGGKTGEVWHGGWNDEALQTSHDIPWEVECDNQSCWDMECYNQSWCSHCSNRTKNGEFSTLGVMHFGPFEVCTSPIKSLWGVPSPTEIYLVKSHFQEARLFFVCKKAIASHSDKVSEISCTLCHASCPSECYHSLDCNANVTLCKPCFNGEWCG